MHTAFLGVVGWLVGIILAFIVMMEYFGNGLIGGSSLATWFIFGLIGAIVGAVIGFTTRSRSSTTPTR